MLAEPSFAVTLELQNNTPRRLNIEAVQGVQWNILGDNLDEDLDENFVLHTPFFINANQQVELMNQPPIFDVNSEITLTQHFQENLVLNVGFENQEGEWRNDEEVCENFVANEGNDWVVFRGINVDNHHCIVNIQVREEDIPEDLV
ncbi:MAG: hypothetical protein AAGA60_24860 [Cyanobacteria bacterium P01_E01_bin.42]